MKKLLTERSILGHVALVVLVVGIMGLTVMGSGQTVSKKFSQVSSALGDGSGVDMAAPVNAPDNSATNSNDSLSPQVAGSTATPTDSAGRVYRRSATVNMEFHKHQLATQAAKIDSVIDKHNAFVLQSNESTTDNSPTGTIIVRVPLAEYPAFMKDLGALGQIVSRQYAAQDEATQDDTLKSNVATFDAQIADLKTQISKASGDTLTELNAKLAALQTQRSQAQDQLDRFTDDVNHVEITLGLAEKANSAVGNQIVRAWPRALNVTESIVAVEILGLGVFVPLAATILTVLFGLKLTRRSRRTAPVIAPAV